MSNESEYMCVLCIMYVNGGGVSYILVIKPVLESMSALCWSWYFVSKMSVTEKMEWRCDNINEE